MAGGGSSELQELREMVDGVIAEMEARIAELENLLLADPLPGGGKSGEKDAFEGGRAKKKPAGKKK